MHWTCWNELDAEDVIQELLVEYGNEEQFDQIENKEAVAMTRNLCIDQNQTEETKVHRMFRLSFHCWSWSKPQTL